MTLPLLATQLVGSYTKPTWLYRKKALLDRELDQVWEPEAAVLEDAQDSAVRLAIKDQERAGIDVITDGEQRRESFANYFYRFTGIDRSDWTLVNERPRPQNTYTEVSTVAAMGRGPVKQLRVAGPIAWKEPISLSDLQFLKAETKRPVKMTVIGPVTAAGRLNDEFYRDPRAITLAVADALNQELRTLDREGVDIIQIDEPDVHMRQRANHPYAVEAIERAIEGVKALTVVHLCYGYSIAIKNKRVDEDFGDVLQRMAASNIGAINLEYEEPGHQPDVLKYCGEKIVVMGALNLGTEDIETPEYIAARIRAALKVVPPERLMLSPDCGMWFLPRPVAFGKARSMALAADIVRHEIMGTSPSAT